MTTDAANGGDGGSAPTTSSSSMTPSILSTPSEVTVHPLVLLSVVDHHTRVARDTRKRVVGVLLGEVGSGGRVDVTNSFAGERLFPSIECFFPPFFFSFFVRSTIDFPRV